MVFPSNFIGQFFGEKRVTDILYSIEVFDGFPEVPNKDMVGLKRLKNLMIDIGCSSSSWRQAGLCGAALGIMPLDGRRGETGKKGELQGVLTVHLGKKKIGQKTYQSTQYLKARLCP